MSHYQYHVFFCTNQREDGRVCCQNFNAQSFRDYMKAKVKEKGLAGVGAVRVSNAGCMDRCELGPVIVVYPEGVWYSYVDQEDIDEIVEQHLVLGKPVQRLMIRE